MNRTVTVEELKNDPLEIVASGNGEAIAVIEGTEVVFFCVPTSLFEAMMDRIEDAELNRIADTREGQPLQKVKLGDL